MPYVLPEIRKQLGDRPPDTAGELNFCITVAVKEYLHRKGRCYQTMNDIVGALDGAKVEFQRVVVAPYEDLKIKENGKIYD